MQVCPNDTVRKCTKALSETVRMAQPTWRTDHGTSSLTAIRERETADVAIGGRLSHQAGTTGHPDQPQASGVDEEMGQQATQGERVTRAGTPPPAEEPHVAESIEEVSALEGKDSASVSVSERIASAVTLFFGSMTFVWVHAVWFSVWTVASLLGLGFAEYPFPLLTMIVSLEAIFLSTFVLISQNRQALRADRRAKVDLQVNLIAEREITEIVRLITEIHDHLGIEDLAESRASSMIHKTDVSRLADAAVDDGP